MLLYAGAALDLSAVPVNRQPLAHGGGVPMYLRSDGGHLDLLVPARSRLQDWTQVFPVPGNEGTEAGPAWVAIGWGEKGFYLQPAAASGFPDPVTTLRAATGLSGAVLRVDYRVAPVVHDTCRFLYASAPQYERLCRYVMAAVVRSPDGRAQPIETSFPEQHREWFYEAKGTYSIFNTCNTWVNSGLRYAGMRACIWTPLARAVLDKYPLEKAQDK